MPGKKAGILFIFLAVCSQLTAQLPVYDNPEVSKIKTKAQIIDSLSNEIVDSLTFDIDSICIVLNVLTNKYETISYFSSSDTKLYIDLYIEKGNVFFIRIVEDSNRFKDLAASITEFYYLEGEFLLSWDYYIRPTGITHKPYEDLDSFYGYNKAFDEDFLRMYSDIIIHKIKKP